MSKYGWLRQKWRNIIELEQQKQDIIFSVEQIVGWSKKKLNAPAIM